MAYRLKGTTVEDIMAFKDVAEKGKKINYSQQDLNRLNPEIVNPFDKY